MENKQLIDLHVANGESEDSDDDKPLSAKLSARLPKGKSHVSKELGSLVLQPQKTKVDVKMSDGDSEDEVPLSSKLPLKTYVRSSSGKSPGSKGLSLHSLSSLPPETKVAIKESSDDSEDEIPLLLKLQSKSRKEASSSKLLDPEGLNSLASSRSQSQNTEVKNKNLSDDSEDEIPLLLKLQSKSRKEASSRKLLDPVGLNSLASSRSQSQKAEVKNTNLSDDSEDEIPLLLKLQLKSKKEASSRKLLDPEGLNSLASSRSQSQKAEVKNKNLLDDSEDEIPLATKFLLKTATGSSLDKVDNFDEKKPLTSTLRPNGINKKDVGQVKSPKGQKKRPLGQINTSQNSSSKKPKLLDGSVKGKAKQVSVKAEQKDDDDDDDDEYTPTVKRMKKSVSSDNKQASLKKTKVISSSRKKATKKSKKLAKSSKYSKSTKVPPNSGEGQKWTTLDHNGVIFPPPYKPHGVKMIYNGRPVDLTPEQEEVGLEMSLVWCLIINLFFMFHGSSAVIKLYILIRNIGVLTFFYKFTLNFSLIYYCIFPLLLVLLSCRLQQCLQ